MYFVVAFFFTSPQACTSDDVVPEACCFRRIDGVCFARHDGSTSALPGFTTSQSDSPLLQRTESWQQRCRQLNYITTQHEVLHCHLQFVKNVFHPYWHLFYSPQVESTVKVIVCFWGCKLCGSDLSAIRENCLRWIVNSAFNFHWPVTVINQLSAIIDKRLNTLWPWIWLSMYAWLMTTTYLWLRHVLLAVIRQSMT